MMIYTQTLCTCNQIFPTKRRKYKGGQIQSFVLKNIIISWKYTHNVYWYFLVKILLFCGIFVFKTKFFSSKHSYFCKMIIFIEPLTMIPIQSLKTSQNYNNKYNKNINKNQTSHQKLIWLSSVVRKLHVDKQWNIELIHLQKAWTLATHEDSWGFMLCTLVFYLCSSCGVGVFTQIWKGTHHLITQSS